MAAIRALVTGADGFTGRYVIDQLHTRGYEISALAHRPATQAHPGVAHTYIADLANLSDLKSVVNDAQADVVIHLAAIAFVAHGDVDAIYSTNLNGARNLLEALKGAAKKPRAVLMASSANVYGNATPGAISEQAVLAPVNDYAVSKVAMEYMARLYMDALPVILTRPFNYTGVGQAENFLLPKIVGHIRRREPRIELGNLDVARDFSDVRSVAHYYRRLIETPEAAGQVFNICSGRAYTLREVTSLACELAGHQMEVHVNSAFVRANEVRVLQGDRTRLNNLISDVPDIELSDTLRWMIEAP